MTVLCRPLQGGISEIVRYSLPLSSNSLGPSTWPLGCPRISPSEMENISAHVLAQRDLQETSDIQSLPSNLKNKKKKNSNDSLFVQNRPCLIFHYIPQMTPPSPTKWMPGGLRGLGHKTATSKGKLMFLFSLPPFFPSTRFQSLRSASTQVFRCKELQQFKLHALAYPA